MTTTITTMFLSTLQLSGFLKVQEDAASQFVALGFPALVTETGAPRFIKVGDSDLLVEFLNEARRTLTVKSFEAAEFDFDTCIQYLGKPDSGGYAPADVRHRVFSAVYEGSTEGFDLDHVCHTDDCDDTNGCVHRMCINPFHMAVTTRSENIKRSMGNRHNNGLATHCKRGHEFTVENTRVTMLGRKCIECEAVYRSMVKSGAHVQKKRSATHCNGGHERELYTVIAKNGTRHCSKCKVVGMQKSVAKKKAAAKK